jgi:uncharacterized protein
MIWAFCVVIGIVSGFMAGLLGIGGGMVIVPALVYSLPQMGVSGGEIPRIAIGTSLAVIVPTAISSARAHASRHAVNWIAFMRIAPGVIVGSFAGAALLSLISSQTVVVIFVAFALFSAWRMADLGKRPMQEVPLIPLPGFPVMAGKGIGIGMMSALVGVGGGILSVPVMSAHVPMRTAIGTGAALGVPISLAAAIGYLLLSQPAGCSSCVGYIFPPVVAAAGVATLFSAPLGARAAHALPVVVLRRLFAVLLVGVAADLTYKSFSQSALPEILSKWLSG